MCLTCHLNWSFKLQVSSKGSACNTFGSSHMQCEPRGGGEQPYSSAAFPGLFGGSIPWVHAPRMAAWLFAQS